MNPRLKALVDFAERTGLGGGRMSYAEYDAVNEPDDDDYPEVR